MSGTFSDASENEIKLYFQESADSPTFATYTTLVENADNCTLVTDFCNVSITWIFTTTGSNKRYRFMFDSEVDSSSDLNLRSKAMI
jgi:hypothetical protein